jgi:nucleoside-diphosphate-sugar epimerase
MSATVLITGANGFIGSHFTKFMESQGHKVVPIDVVPRAPDLTLLGVRAASHLMNVTDGAAFRALCEKERPTHYFMPPTAPR